MDETSLERHQKTILAILERAKDARLSASELQKKLGLTSKTAPKDGLDAPEANQAITGLIEKGLIEVASGTRDGPYPHAGASYRLTEKGRHHLRPPRPDVPDEQLQAQEAFILMQVFRAKEKPLTRSKLNDKLKTMTAKGQLELDIKEAPETISYHLAELVAKGCLSEERKGISVSYSLDQGRGIGALATVKQHDAVSFTLNGATLNALLTAARQSKPVERKLEESSLEAELADTAPPTSQPLGPMDIQKYIEQLLADKYAGKDLIPIHEVRRLVAEHHGAEAAGHPEFDPLIKRMRSDRQLRLIAISDNRDATQEQLNESIPGMNEILFYIVIR